MNKLTLISLLMLLPAFLPARENLRDWTVEAESNESRITLDDNGAVDIIAPKGLTLWYNRLMQGNVTIEYDARIVVEKDNTNSWNRLSDLNCFWMATDPEQRDGNVFQGLKRRKGIFVNQYALSLYYLGYGGNHNTTTRFRRYDGDKRGVDDASFRPSILREYTDSAHLLKPNHWYHVRIEQRFGTVRCYIDGKCIVNYVDIRPFYRGYFGFRTTLSHAQLKNFKYREAPVSGTPMTLRWIENKANESATPQTFGVPFLRGELATSDRLLLSTSKGTAIPHDEWNLAYWDDGSVKWRAVAGVIPENTDSCLIRMEKGRKKTASNAKVATETADEIKINTGNATVFISRNGDDIIDSIMTCGKKSTGKIWIEANGKRLRPTLVTLEQNGLHRACVRIDGEKFTLRLYAYRGSNELKAVHTLLVDNSLNNSGLSSLGLRIAVPMRTPDHLRKVSFAKSEESDYQSFTVKPLIARRPVRTDEKGVFLDRKSGEIAAQLASWDAFRLSQVSPNAFSIRKRATSRSPWIGTMEGYRSPGELIVGDGITSIKLLLSDFWQSYPSSLQVDDARSPEAVATLWLWSPEAEKKSFEHYDTIAHSLEAAYEDVQKGMSAAEGIARTSVIYLTPDTLDVTQREHYKAKQTLVPTPEYLHSRRAFGIWSLPDGDDIDREIRKIADFYVTEQDRQSWYGMFDYGDVMHTYDLQRGQWRYDVGGYAWDNTELGTNAMIWYNFLRSGREEDWRLAVAMTRHTGEVDCYHFGPHAGLGSRHNVSHWGCGAKEARISQAFWNRFLYYLTADERSGDLMREVRDADTLLYYLDPMRLAQPRSPLYPCSAPARLRIGPDWMAYAGNWFTEWERTLDRKYYDKIITGMKSIASLPHGLFSGPKALGYDPATGVISWEGDSAVQNTNHLMTIMGGFETMNEMMLSIDCREWNKAWLDHAVNYRSKAWEISKNKFKIPRLQAYAYWKTGNRDILKAAMDDMTVTPFSSKDIISTNSCATWSLDAVFLKEMEGGR